MFYCLEGMCFINDVIDKVCYRDKIRMPLKTRIACTLFYVETICITVSIKAYLDLMINSGVYSLKYKLVHVC